MTHAPTPPLRLAIDTDALAGNWRWLNDQSGVADAGAAIKANAYGVGAAIAAPALRDAGARQFYLAHWGEVADILPHIPASEIAVLHGACHHEEASFARAHGVFPVVNSLAQAKIWVESGGGPCHLMVDTGINRIGLSVHECGAEIIRCLDVDMLMSHLASADEDSAMNAQQLRRFHDAAGQIAHKRLSLANSAGIMLGAEYHFAATRPGLSLYGGIARPEMAPHIAQVVYPESAVLQKRRIEAGESVGYNATFTARAPMDIAVINLGYADGFLRSRGHGAHVTYGDAKLPILGRVSMDMIVIDITAAPFIKEGDWVQIPFNLLEIAAQSGLSQYELLTSLGLRFARDVKSG